MYVPRAIEFFLLRAIQQFPAILITGPRQAGKSTLLKHTLPQFKYVTLDDPMVRALAREDPALFCSSYAPPLIIDEVQYVPELLSYLKLRIDANRREYGQYVLTGSQTFQLMKGVTETLAGRMAIFDLYPFTWQELAQSEADPSAFFSDQSLARQLVTGFYPEFVATPDIDRNLWFGSYLSTYIERDVRNITAITDLGRFQTFVALLAGRAGQLLNISEVCKECGISQPTGKSWLSVLESSYIIRLLQPYFKNTTKRLIKSPKLYFVDTGLLCYLLGIDSEERFFKAAERGHIFENMVIMDCIKHLSYQEQRSHTYFYRTASGVEVDLLIEKGNELSAYEIKLSKTPSRDMVDSLKRFKEEFSPIQSKLVSLREDSIPLAPGVESTHWSQIIS